MDQQLLSELRVSAPLINDQLSEQASRYAHYGSLASDAARDAKAARTSLKVIEAQIVTEVRTNWSEAEGRRSEWIVKSIVRSDPRWAEAWNRYHVAKHRSDVMQVAKEAFAQRKDLLVTMAANLRGEMGGQVRLNKQPAKNEEEDLGTYIEQTLSKPPNTRSNLNKLQQTFRQQKENQE